MIIQMQMLCSIAMMEYFTQFVLISDMIVPIFHNPVINYCFSIFHLIN